MKLQWGEKAILLNQNKCSIQNFANWLEAEKAESTKKKENKVMLVEELTAAPNETQICDHICPICEGKSFHKRMCYICSQIGE